MTLRLIPALCLLASPALGQDDCPRGPGALDAGITIDFGAMRIDYRREAGDRILETERYEGEAEVWFYRSDPTGLIHEAWAEGPGGIPDEATRESYRYDFAGGLPRAEPGTNWTGQETSVIGGVEEANLVSWSFSKLEAYTIGGCTYDAIRIFETRTSPTDAAQPPWISQYVHLVDLGMSIFLGGDELGVEPGLEVPRAIFMTAKAN